MNWKNGRPNCRKESKKSQIELLTKRAEEEAHRNSTLGLPISGVVIQFLMQVDSIMRQPTFDEDREGE